MSSAIGERIVRFRKNNGISQKYLAKKIGLSSQGLLKIERGLVNPRVSTVEKIIEVTGLTPNQIFGVEEMEQREVLDLLRSGFFNE